MYLRTQLSCRPCIVFDFITEKVRVRKRENSGLKQAATCDASVKRGAFLVHLQEKPCSEGIR